MATWLLDANVILYRLARDHLLQDPRVVCEEAEAVLAGLLYHGKVNLDFVVGYLAARAGGDDVYLLTNDKKVRKRTAAQIVEW